jgi:micrococcal nuclease
MKNFNARTSLYRVLLLCFFFTLGCTSSAADTSSPNTLVYVGRSGTKYHRADCYTIRNSKRAISLSEAERAGYGPCSLCKPDSGEDTASGSDTVVAVPENSAVYRVNIAQLSSYRQADIKKMLPAKVTRHIDGDTVHVTLENPPAGFNKVEKIRMIGVDTPETVHPSRDVEYFGKEASDFTKNALLGKNVYLALDWDTRDRYGRLLAYIYTTGGECHNAELVKQGFAHAYTRFPFQFLEEFRGLERQARAKRAGLWSGG